MRREDVEHWRWMAAHHQRWVTRYAWLFSIFGVLAFFVSPWLFVSASIFALQIREHRQARNHALEVVMRGLADGLGNGDEK